MAKTARQVRQLKALFDRADLLADTARKEWRKTVREIRKEIAFMSRQLDVGGSSADRERIIRQVQFHINRLNRRLDRMMDSQMMTVAKAAHDEALIQTQSEGSVLRFDPAYAKETLKLIQARSGGGMAATFTKAMSQNAVTALRYAVVSAFQEHAATGGSARELANLIRDKWEAVAANERNFRFIDRAGREWDTARYIQMNVRANTMRIYNHQIVADFAKAYDSDFARISKDGRTSHSCESCQFWAGRIVSISGKARGFPSIQDAEKDGLFHPNCIHTLEPVHELFDEDEIAAAREYYAENGWRGRNRKRKAVE